MDLDFLFVFRFKGNTYLHLAAKTGQLEVFETILSDENIEKSPKNQNDSTPLHLACEYGQTNIVAEMLLKKSTHFKATDKYGWTAFHIACRNDQVNVAWLIMKNSVRVCIKKAAR